MGVAGNRKPDTMNITSLMSPWGEVAIAALYKEKNLFVEELPDEVASED